jgi:hypothetical protein
MLDILRSKYMASTQRHTVWTLLLPGDVANIIISNNQYERFLDKHDRFPSPGLMNLFLFLARRYRQNVAYDKGGYQRNAASSCS